MIILLERQSTLLKGVRDLTQKDFYGISIKTIGFPARVYEILQEWSELPLDFTLQNSVWDFR